MDKAKKFFYTMGDIAEEFGVTQSLIRYWDKEFIITKRDKDSNKKINRIFGSKELDKFRLVYHLLKEKGMTLKGAKLYMSKGAKEDVTKDIIVVEKLSRIKLLLQEVLSNFKDDTTGDKIVFENRED